MCVILSARAILDIRVYARTLGSLPILCSSGRSHLEIKRWNRPTFRLGSLGKDGHALPRDLSTLGTCALRLYIGVMFSSRKYRCGNGLLTHILISEGYEGHGIDLRERMSWKSYPPDTQNHLHVHVFNPLDFSFDKNPAFLPSGVFIIANHADELTPWTPVLSTLCSASGYLSIPCCAWDFDSRYERSATTMFPIPNTKSVLDTDIDSERIIMNEFIKTLNLGGDGSNTSGYSMYRIWLATLSVYTGWEVECETLRIPSTRNWAIIGMCICVIVREEDHEDRVSTQGANDLGLCLKRKR